MKHVIRPKTVAVFVAVGMIILAAPGSLEAQRGRGRGGPPPAAQTIAPIDVTGYWVAMVTEDWRFRMGVGVKGEYGRTGIPLNVPGRNMADSWDPEADIEAGDLCKSYGAAGIMRVPTRLNITWASPNTLRVETDNGMKTRALHFGPGAAAPAEATPLGHSIARWVLPGPQGPGGFGMPTPPQARGGELAAETDNMTPGYYFTLDGMPYSDQTSMTEYWNMFTEPDGNSYLLVTLMVDDPVYLTNSYVRSYGFKKEPNGSKFDPRPCEVYIPQEGGALIEGRQGF